MKWKILFLAFVFWTVCCGIAMASGDRVPLNESMGAGGLADSFNDLTFDDKKVYITSCKKLPDFTGKEIYLLETNIGAPGDNGKDKAEYGSQLLISQEEIDKEFGITGKDLEGWKEVEIR